MIPVAKDIMTAELLAVDADWTIQQLAEFFDEHSISGAPVTDAKGEIVGVVSLMDIVRQNSQPLIDVRTEHSTHDYYLRSLQKRLAYEELGSYSVEHEPETSVKDIMTTIIFDVDENTPVTDIAHTMITGHIHRVFVTREKRVVGVVSSLDMLKVIRDWPYTEAA